MIVDPHYDIEGALLDRCSYNDFAHATPEIWLKHLRCQKLPEHSSTISTLASSDETSSGAWQLQYAMWPLLISIPCSVATTGTPQRPWTLSNSSRWAAASGPSCNSLIGRSESENCRTPRGARDDPFVQTR